MVSFTIFGWRVRRDYFSGKVGQGFRAASSKRQKAEGRRQKAEGRRQKAEGRRQKAETLVSNPGAVKTFECIAVCFVPTAFRLLPTAFCLLFFQNSSSSSSSSRSSSSTMSSSTGSSPTTSSSVPHSSQETLSPLSVSVSTWTSASHSGHVPVGTSLPPAD